MYLTFGIRFSLLHSSESGKAQNNPSCFRYVSFYYAIYKQILCFDVKKKTTLFTTNRDIFLVFFWFERILFYECTPEIYVLRQMYNVVCSQFVPSLLVEVTTHNSEIHKDLDHRGFSRFLPRILDLWLIPYLALVVCIISDNFEFSAKQIYMYILCISLHLLDNKD